jgi:hypothetical protein
MALSAYCVFIISGSIVMVLLCIQSYLCVVYLTMLSVISCYTASNGWTLQNNVLERMWKEVAIA